MTLRIIIVTFFLVSLKLCSQTTLSKDSFYIKQDKLPQDYKTIVGDPKGWRGIGHYNVYTGKVDLKLSPWVEKIH